MSAAIQTQFTGQLRRPPLLAEPLSVRRLSMLWMQPGETRHFGTEDIGTAGLLAGWAAAEPGHAWNDGFDATLRIATDRADQPMLLTLAAEPYVTRQNPIQDVTVYANGARAGFWRLTARDVAEMPIWIDPSWWTMQDGSATLRLVVFLPQSVSPRELGDGEDMRLLGLSFRSLTLSPINEN
jgi:hypothetical protein